jgi:SAM-dependent methyltransferase
MHTYACVGELGQDLGIVGSTISHHIKELRRAGLIRRERQGQKIVCWIDPQPVFCFGTSSQDATRCCGPLDHAPNREGDASGYSQEDLVSAPQGSNMGLGCGNPVALASLIPGETVVDMVMSNCVIILSPDKKAVYGDVLRVLKPGGRIAISDILTKTPLPEKIQGDLIVSADIQATKPAAI